MSVPDVQTVRECIESVQREDIRHCLQFIYIAGAARVIEAVGKLAPNDSTHYQAYGPHGTDVTLTEYQPKIPKWAQVTLTDAQLAKAFKPVPTALFTVKIAKKKLATGEEPLKRIVALPMPKEIEPWTQGLYSYFQKRGDKTVFPFTRQTVWWWITKKEPIFQGLVYPIEKYQYTEKEVTKIKLPHNKPFKLHALRHLRVKELREDYGFDGLDLITYVGWATSHATRSTGQAIPMQFGTYGQPYSNWKAYYPKLLGE